MPPIAAAARIAVDAMITVWTVLVCASFLAAGLLLTTLTGLAPIIALGSRTPGPIESGNRVVEADIPRIWLSATACDVLTVLVVVQFVKLVAKPVVLTKVIVVAATLAVAILVVVGVPVEVAVVVCCCFVTAIGALDDVGANGGTNGDGLFNVAGLTYRLGAHW